MANKAKRKREKEQLDPEKAKSKRKQAEPQMSRIERLGVVTDNIIKQYAGKIVLLQGSEITNVFVLRRPTGIISLDLKLNGGFPAGGLSQVIGAESSGKSYLLMRTISNVQQIYGKDAAIGICMTEMPWDKAFAKWWCGVKVAFNDLEIQRLQKLNQEYARPAFTPEHIQWLKEQVGTVQEVRAATAEHLLEIACQMVESNLYQIIVIDSFGALLTMAEAEAEEGLVDKHRGGASMTITQFMHRLHAALNMMDAEGRPNTTSVLGINQMRDNVNAGMFGNPVKQAGGWALKHGKLIDLQVSQGKRHRIDQKGPNYGKIVGKEINWEILKGKAGCHDGPKGTYNFYFGELGYPMGIDTMSDLMVSGLEYGAIEQNGAWYYFRGEALGQGGANAAANLASNPEWIEEVKKDIYARAGLTFITREDW